MRVSSPTSESDAPEDVPVSDGMLRTQGMASSSRIVLNDAVADSMDPVSGENTDLSPEVASVLRPPASLQSASVSRPGSHERWWAPVVAGVALASAMVAAAAGQFGTANILVASAGMLTLARWAVRIRWLSAAVFACVVASAVAAWLRANSVQAWLALSCSAVLVLWARGFADARRARVVENQLREREAQLDASGSSSVAIRVGEEVTAAPGDIVPVDGVVTEGEANMVPWPLATTESSRSVGHVVAAGARIVRGTLRLRAIRTGADRGWMRFRLALGPSRTLAGIDSMATRAMVITAFACGTALWLITHNALESLFGVMAVLTSFAAAGLSACHRAAEIRAAIDIAEAGALVKDTDALHRLSHAHRAVFSERAVLSPEAEMVDIVCVQDLDEDRVLGLFVGALTAAGASEWAGARSCARWRDVRAIECRNAVFSPGLGATATDAHGAAIVVGGRSLFLRERISIAAAESKLAELESKGRSVVLVGVAGKLVGFVALQKSLRTGVRGAVDALHRMHVEPILLSSESRTTGETVARALGIEHVRAEVLADDQPDEIASLQAGVHDIVVVGRPPQDERILAAGDVSIALDGVGYGHVDSSVCLAGDDMRTVAFAFERARRLGRRNLLLRGFGLSVPAAVAVGLAFGVMPPFVAGIACVVAGAHAAYRVTNPS